MPAETDKLQANEPAQRTTALRGLRQGVIPRIVTAGSLTLHVHSLKEHGWVDVVK